MSVHVPFFPFQVPCISPLFPVCFLSRPFHVPFISLSLPFRFFLFHAFHALSFPPEFPCHFSFISFHVPSFALLFPFISLSWLVIYLFNSCHCWFINSLDFHFLSLLFHCFSFPFIIFHVCTYLRLYWMYLYIYIYQNTEIGSVHYLCLEKAKGADLSGSGM